MQKDCENADPQKVPAPEEGRGKIILLF